jgi:hypothetical protein
MTTFSVIIRMVLLQTWANLLIYSGLSNSVQACTKNLNLAISLLGVNVEATALEVLHELDEKVVKGQATLEEVLKKLQDEQSAEFDRITTGISDVHLAAEIGFKDLHVTAESGFEQIWRDISNAQLDLTDRSAKLEKILMPSEETDKANRIIENLGAAELKFQKTRISRREREHFRLDSGYGTVRLRKMAAE